MKVLGDTVNLHVSDKYSGYNKVTVPGWRQRAGCHAHVRRKFFDARSTSPEAQTAMDFIVEVYKVERAALTRICSGPTLLWQCASRAAAR